MNFAHLKLQLLLSVCYGLLWHQILVTHLRELSFDHYNDPSDQSDQSDQVTLMSRFSRDPAKLLKGLPCV